MKKEKVYKFIVYCYYNFDVFLTCLLAVVAAVISIFGGKQEYVIATIATVLVVITITTLRERKSRDDLITEVQKLSGNITADNFFSRKSNEQLFISKAKKEIILIQESGQLISETCRQHLLDFIHANQDGRIRIVTTLNKVSITELMAFRNANLTPELMGKRLVGGLDMIKVLSDFAGQDSNRIEVRFFPYPCDITAVFIDPNHDNLKNREALIRLQGFKVTFDDKLDFSLNGYYSNTVYGLYKKQMEKIWQMSIKCLLITGKPGVGKSTVLNRVVDEIKKSKKLKVVGFITLSTVDPQGNRIGFITSTLDGKHSGSLSEKKNEKYILNKETMSKIIHPALAEGIESADLLVIDEIGPIQLQDHLFKELILKALNKPTLSILGTISTIETFGGVAEIHHHFRTGIIEMTEQNRHRVESKLLNEFVDFTVPKLL